MRYCAYRERTHQEVRSKLYELGLSSQSAEEAIVELIQQNMINEERFAQAYARGKFRDNKWGRQKIKRMLQSKMISPYCIQKALDEIDDQMYLQQLEQLTSAYMKKHRNMDLFLLRKRTAFHLIGKGYEGDLVWDAIKGSDD